MTCTTVAQEAAASACRTHSEPQGGRECADVWRTEEAYIGLADFRLAKSPLHGARGQCP